MLPRDSAVSSRPSTRPPNKIFVSLIPCTHHSVSLPFPASFPTHRMSGPDPDSNISG